MIGSRSFGIPVAMATDAELAEHAADTTDVHGIANTATLLQATVVDAKGDLLAATGADAVTRLPAGTDGHVLKAASGQSAGLQWAAPTDTSTVPIADSAAATAGGSLLGAPRDHAHPRVAWTATDHGFLTWSILLEAASTSTALATAGTVYLTRVHLPVASSVTNIVGYVGTAGNTLTAGQCFAALYSAAGAKLDQTADQASAWGSTGLKTMALAGGAASRPAGDYYIAVWFNGTTGPAFARGSGLAAALVNANLSAPNLRFASADTGVTTTGPSNLGGQTVISLSYWFGLS